MKKYFLPWLAAMALIVVTSSAFATTAAFAGKFTSYPAGLTYFPVRVGEKVQLHGTCYVKEAIEQLLRVEWTIDGIYTKSEAHPPTGDQYSSFVVAGPAHRDFQAKIQCMTQSAWTTNDAAYATFRVMEDTPPAVTADPRNALYARDDITIKVHAAGTGDGVKEVFIQWPGAPGTSERMTFVSGDLYQYKIPTKNLPEGPVAVQVWANSDHGANNGWQDIRGFTVDHTPPALSAASFEYAEDFLTITVPVRDNVSGIRYALLRSNTGAGWSPQKGMTRIGATDRYFIKIYTGGMADGQRIAYQARADDKAGNGAPWSDVGSFTLPHEGPTIAWDKSNARFARDKILIRANAMPTPGFTVAQVWLWWQGAPGSGYRMKDEGGGAYSYTIPTAGLQEGVAKTVQFWARDNAGEVRNWMTPPGSSFTVDRTPPAITVKSQPSGKALRDDLDFTLNISDAVSRLDPAYTPQICWTQKNADGSWPGCTHPEDLHPGGADYRFTIPVAGLRDGDLKVAFNARDQAGNTHLLSDGAWPDGPHFIIDRTPPVIDWQAPRDSASLTGDSMHIAGAVADDNPDYVAIEWQAENDPAWQSHRVRINRSNAFEYDLPGLAQGVNYRVRLHAVDQAGNVSEVTPARNIIGQLAADALFKNALLSIADDSLVDKDDSGGFSSGDDALYALALATGKDAANKVSLRYALPAGLAMTPGARPFFADGSDIRDGGKLNANWNGGSDTQLLADGVDLKANGKLLLHIPVTITAPPARSPIASTVLAGAKNARDELTLTHSLALQGIFPARRALGLELASLQPNWKYAPGTVFDYRITVHVLDWGLTGFALNYALPQGLEKHGAARIEETGASALALNPAWGKNGVKLLLTSMPGAMLAARHSFTAIVPVKVIATAPGSVLRSEVEAGATNLDGPVSAMHRIVLDGSGRHPEEQLTLKKTVDRQTARPGQTLRYTITYANVGIDDLHDLVIRDAIQSEYLTLQSTQCGPITPKTIECRAVAREHGALEWHLDGRLEAGDFGSVGYEVLINEQ